MASVTSRSLIEVIDIILSNLKLVKTFRKVKNCIYIIMASNGLEWPRMASNSLERPRMALNSLEQPQMVPNGLEWPRITSNSLELLGLFTMDIRHTRLCGTFSSLYLLQMTFVCPFLCSKVKRSFFPRDNKKRTKEA